MCKQGELQFVSIRDSESDDNTKCCVCGTVTGRMYESEEAPNDRVYPLCTDCYNLKFDYCFYCEACDAVYAFIDPQYEGPEPPRAVKFYGTVFERRDCILGYPDVGVTCTKCANNDNILD